MPFQDRRAQHHDAEAGAWQPHAHAPKKPKPLQLPPARWPRPPASVWDLARWQAEVPPVAGEQVEPGRACEVVRCEGGRTVVRGLCYPEAPSAAQAQEAQEREQARRAKQAAPQPDARWREAVVGKRGRG